MAEALKPLARRYHVAILVLHHCNKLVNPEDPLDAISGSTGLVAPADIKAVFTRARGEADAKLFVTGRAVREQWAAFKFEEGYWTYLGDAKTAEASEARRSNVQCTDISSARSLVAPEGRLRRNWCSSAQILEQARHAHVRSGDYPVIAGSLFGHPNVT